MAFLGVALLCAGCIEEFDPPWRIEDHRLLGARSEVRGEPERAWPQPGETADVRWLSVAPGERPELTWAFAWCPAAPSQFGTPYCVDGTEPTILPPQLEPTTDDPTFAVEVPADEADLRGATSLLTLGFVCAGGVLEVDPALLDDPARLDEACPGDDAKASLVTFEVPVALSDAPNHNPAVAAVRLDGAPWAPPPDEALEAPLEGCPPTWGLPEVRAGGPEREIALEVPSESRERYEVAGEDGEPTTRVEALQVAQTTTAGELGGYFRFIEDEGDTESTVQWEPPPEEELRADRELVRFHFVVVDRRAGTAFAHRALCVTRGTEGG
ncbi:MAG: hypothetical protein ACODAU_07610 [Myxococcota bacterium]